MQCKYLDLFVSFQQCRIVIIRLERLNSRQEVRRLILASSNAADIHVRCSLEPVILMTNSIKLYVHDQHSII